MMKSNIILLINNGIGGAEKRFFNLFLKLQDRGEYLLVVNENLYNYLKLLNNFKKIDDRKIRIIKEPYLRIFSIFLNKISIINKIFSLIQRFNIFLFIIKSQLFKQVKYVHAVLEGIRYISLIKLINPEIVISSSVVDTTAYFLKKKQICRGLELSNAIDFLNKELSIITNKKLKLKNTVSKITPKSFINAEEYKCSKKKRELVVYSARMSPEKNPFLFLDAVYVCHQKGYGKKLAFILLGDGVLYNKVKEKVNKLKEKGINISAKGFVSDPGSFLKNALIYVQITKREMHATQSLLEAMACCCAIVTTEVPGIENVVSNDIGIRCDYSAESIADSIIWLYENFDNSIKMGRRARINVVQNFHINSFVDYFTNLYEKNNRLNFEKNFFNIISLIKEFISILFY